MSRLGQMGIAMLLVAGCGSDPGALVNISLDEGSRGDVCFWAEEVGLTDAPLDEASFPGSVVLLPGERFSQDLPFSISLRSGGRVLGRGGAVLSLPAGGDVRLPSCAAGLRFRGELGVTATGGAGGEVLRFGTLDLGGHDGVVVGGEGQSEIFSRRGSEGTTGDLRFAADLDGDCRLERYGQGQGHLRDEAQAVSLEGSAYAWGDGGRGPRLAVAGEGLHWVEVGVSTRRLADGRWGSIALGDVDADGTDDVVAGAEAGALVLWRGSEAGPQRSGSVEMAPPEHIAFADLQGNGRLARNSIVVTFGQSIGAWGWAGELSELRRREFGASVEGLVVLDRDGDCRDEIAVIVAGEVIVLDSELLELERLGPARGIAGADLLGTGGESLVVLRPDGTVEAL